jgi:hypothetical protein
LTAKDVESLTAKDVESLTEMLQNCDSLVRTHTMDMMTLRISAVQGSFAAPKVRVDNRALEDQLKDGAEGALKDEAKSRVEDKIKSKLGDRLKGLIK